MIRAEIKKNIKFKNEVVIEMTLEDVMARFDKQVRWFAKGCVGNINNGYELEDFLQVGYMTVMKCFEEYDDKYIFSSYLVQKLKGENYKMFKSTTRQKRSASVISLQAETNQGSEGEATTMEDIIGTLDNAIESLAGEDLVGKIFSTLNDEEKHIYLNIIENETKASDYAYSMGMTRQALNYKLKKLKDKLSSLYITYSNIA